MSVGDHFCILGMAEIEKKIFFPCRGSRLSEIWAKNFTSHPKNQKWSVSVGDHFCIVGKSEFEKKIFFPAGGLDLDKF